MARCQKLPLNNPALLIPELELKVGPFTFNPVTKEPPWVNCIDAFAEIAKTPVQEWTGNQDSKSIVLSLSMPDGLRIFQIRSNE